MCLVRTCLREGQREMQEPTALKLPGILLKRRFLGPHPRLNESDVWGRSLEIPVFNNILSGFHQADVGDH